MAANAGVVSPAEQIPISPIYGVRLVVQAHVTHMGEMIIKGHIINVIVLCEMNDDNFG